MHVRVPSWAAGHKSLDLWQDQRGPPWGQRGQRKVLYLQPADAVESLKKWLNGIQRSIRQQQTDGLSLLRVHFSGAQLIYGHIMQNMSVFTGHLVFKTLFFCQWEKLIEYNVTLENANFAWFSRELLAISSLEGTLVS